jgi:hypothetical protein
MIRPYAILPVETALAGRTVDRQEISIASFDGTQVALTILSPAGADLSAGNASCMYWVHGGGMVMGDRYFQIDIPLDWLASFGAVVVSGISDLAAPRGYTGLMPVFPVCLQGARPGCRRG